MKLWRDVHTEYDISDVGGIELLAQACAAVDQAEALADDIAADGRVIRTRSGPKVHPALKEQLAHRAFACRVLHRLGLNVESVKDVGRPSGGVGITWDKIKDRNQ
jgi:hypothetical protein